ncbi:Glutamine synthetase [compost metagenome]
MSLADGNGESLFANPEDPGQLSALGKHFLAGMVSHAREMSAIFLPTLNSYKRTAGASWAGGNASWGFDNRTVSHRAITSAGSAARVENRIPGADTNPHLVVAAILLSGLEGIQKQLNPNEPILGNAYHVSAEKADPLATSLEEAARLFSQSETAREMFTPEFVDHYVQMKKWELRQNAAFITDWELKRYLSII